MSRSEPLRVAILATHPIQYQAPLWRKLAARPALKVHVFYGSDLSIRGYRDEGFGVDVRWDIPLTQGYEHTFLSRDPSLQRITFRRPRASGLGGLLDQFKPDVVLLTAYNSLFWLGGLMAARLRRIPVVMRHEASDEAVSRSWLKHLLRDTLLRVVYAQVAGFAAIGTNARNHLLRLGVPAERIGWSPYCVDSEQLEKQVERWLPQRTELRRLLGVKDGDFVLIFSGKLIEKKQPLLIPQAVLLLPDEIRQRIHLIVVGDGEQRAELEREGRAVFGSRLHLAGFVNQSEIGRWYAAADGLVLPSKKGAGETWGLVVNEALQFGLPVIVSDGVGCHRDLIDGSTGALFPADSVEDLARVLGDAVGGRWPVTTAACAPRAGLFSLGAAAEGLQAALMASVNRSPAGTRSQN